jgi:hypothetical protein
MTKKATKIYSTDTEKLNAAIIEAEGRATARTMNAEYVDSKLFYVVNRYLNGLPKKALTGTRATVHASTEKLPSSYKYRAESTQAEFLHDGKGWVLVSVWRGTLRQSSAAKEGVELELTDTAKEWLLDSLKFI